MARRQPQVRVLPKALKAWRNERNLTQFDLAEGVGCSDTLIALIETGRRHPSYKNALAMAEILGVDLEAFAVVQGEPEPEEVAS